jgi:hypothetical protein
MFHRNLFERKCRALQVRSNPRGVLTLPGLLHLQPCAAGCPTMRSQVGALLFWALMIATFYSLVVPLLCTTARVASAAAYGSLTLMAVAAYLGVRCAAYMQAWATGTFLCCAPRIVPAVACCFVATAAAAVVALLCTYRNIQQHLHRPAAATAGPGPAHAARNEYRSVRCLNSLPACCLQTLPVA